MEKMIWTRPIAEVEQFMPNEYIAKCEDTENHYYKFVCDAGSRNGNTVYFEKNNVEGLQIELGNGGDYYRTGSYYPCGEIHYAPLVNQDFIDGYILTGLDVKDWKPEYYKVLIWTDNDTNVHCTKQLINEVEIIKGNKS